MVSLGKEELPPPKPFSLAETEWGSISLGLLIYVEYSLCVKQQPFRREISSPPSCFCAGKWLGRGDRSPPTLWHSMSVCPLLYF